VYNPDVVHFVPYCHFAELAIRSLWFASEITTERYLRHSALPSFLNILDLLKDFGVHRQRN
jgi:hypothetical protein